MESGIKVIEVTTLPDGRSAVDSDGNKYKIKSIMLGVGFKRKSIPYEKKFLTIGIRCRAEILADGKLNII